MNALQVEHKSTESRETIDPATIDRQCINSFQELTKDRKKRILIIEDNRNLADLMSMIFEDDGHVEIADNGSIGLSKISKTYFDVIISDIEMPVMNGVEFFYQALKIYPDIGERIVFCSGSSKEAHHRFIHKYCLQYLPKPYGIEELRGVVYDIMNDISQ
jgi:two-component system chemotaxis response regulator CheY